MAVRRFELRGRELLTQVISTAWVFVPPKDGETAKAFEVRALWDTGATHCQVTPEMAEKMGLRSLGQTDNNTAAGKMKSEVYQLGLVISEQICYPKLYFGVSNGAGRFDIVIGMNALQYGSFSLYGQGDERRMEFVIED